MKLWKRFGAALIAILTLTAILAGTAIAAEPEQSGNNTIGTLFNGTFRDSSTISVQLNGEFLSFTDAVPEITDNRTFLPFRAVLEAMGAQVSYDAATKTVSAQRNGVTIAMVPGQKEMSVTEDGQTHTITMDVAPYIKASNNRTYVAVRYAAEALGYSVGWDAYNRTVIIVDVDALLGDATFELIDNYNAYFSRQETPENTLLTGNINFNIEDKTGTRLSAPLKMNGSIDGILGEKGYQLTEKSTLSGLSEVAQMFAQEATPMELMMIQSVLGSLSDLSAETRLDQETQMIYFSFPTELTGMENTWYSLDLSVSDIAEASLPQDAGIRDLLVWWIAEILPLDDAYDSYDSLVRMAEMYTDLFSDQAFVQSGNTYTAQSQLEDLMNLTLILTKEGNDIVAADLKMDANIDEYGTKMIMVVTAHATFNKFTIDMTMSMVDEDISVSFDMELTCVPTSKTPVTIPPADAQIVPMD